MPTPPNAEQARQALDNLRAENGSTPVEDEWYATLRQFIESAEADAKRLDHIASNARCDPKMDGQHVWWPTSFNHRLIGPTLREAIDAARTPQPGQEPQP